MTDQLPATISQAETADVEIEVEHIRASDDALKPVTYAEARTPDEAGRLLRAAAELKRASKSPKRGHP